VDQASEWARSILPRFSAFSVQLCSVQTFPQSNVLYLTASDEERKLFQIHSALNSGPLFDEERYEFRPHLTLGGPIEPSALPAARNAAETAWAEYREERQFTVDELVALSGTAGTEQSERVTWNRLWNYSLSASRWKAAGAAGQPSG
jgi:2'-5' RNA ligase